MKRKFLLLLLILQIFTYSPIFALSLVYSFRVSQVTRQPIVKIQEKRPNSMTYLLFDLFQKMHGFNVKENYGGGMITYNRNFGQHCYFRADIAAANVHQKTNGILNTNVTEPDDILFTIGRNFQAGDKAKVTVSGLFGIPTHSIYTLERVGFGYGQVGLGIQIDGLYKFARPVDFIWGARYNYFVPGNAVYLNGDSYKFSTGNIVDGLIALQTSNLLSHGLEGGYAPRWGFGVKACPNNIPNLDLLNYMRHNFYLVYKYTFLGKHAAHRLLLTLSYGVDQWPKNYGYDAVMVWGSWSIAF